MCRSNSKYNHDSLNCCIYLSFYAITLNLLAKDVSAVLNKYHINAEVKNCTTWSIQGLTSQEFEYLRLK